MNHILSEWQLETTTETLGAPPLKKAMKPFLASCIQFNPVLNEWEKNIRSLFQLVKEAASNGAKLIVTPEMATTGYEYKSRAAIANFVDTIPGKTTNIFQEIAAQFEVYIAIGMPEVDEATGIYYNSAALVGPEGYIGKYRKMHLWETESRWAAPGDLGVSVFQTPIGNISMNICMDAVYMESARLAAVQGADILAFLTNSSAQTIAALQSRAEMNGLYIVSANRSNTENGFHMVGSSTIWSPYGEKICEASYISTPEDDMDEPSIIYGEIDPVQYNNDSKRRLSERKPELYKNLMLYIAPWDLSIEPQSLQVVAAAIQYEPVIANKHENIAKISVRLEQAIEHAAKEGNKLDLVVLPELALTGYIDSLDFEDFFQLSDSRESMYIQQMNNLAKMFEIYLIFGFIERDNEYLFNSAALISPQGEIVGIYRKTHLSQKDKVWATAGQDIPIFSTPLGRIGMMIGYEAVFPELTSLMAVNRADIIAIPSNWRGEFGGNISINPNHAINKYPIGSMSIWNAVSTGAQAYTIVANFVGGEQRFLGCSALYTLDPIYGLDQVEVGSNDSEENVIVKFDTKHNEWWFNQEKLICSRKTFFYKPLIYNLD